MLHRKDTNKIYELKNGFTQSWVEPDFIASSLKSFSFSKLCNCLLPLKTKGYGIHWIMTVLISMPFINKATVNSMYAKHVKTTLSAQKDVFYRLKNAQDICWRLILWLFANKFVKLGAKGGDECLGPKCLIFDDTLLEKTGRCIELVSKVWDHVTNRKVLGFKMLLAGLWDGRSFVPLDFSLHRERGKDSEKPFGLTKRENKRQHHKFRETGTAGYERTSEADMSKVKIAIKMFKRAIAQGLKFDYVLLDSWFTCNEIIDAILSCKRCKVHLIGMYSKVKSAFLYKDEQLTYGQINNKLGKPKRCRKLRLHYKIATVEHKGKELKLCFCKQGKSKWRTVICTDTSLTFLKIMEIYQIRWSIEVFFKEAKQLLGLGRCQSNDFDAQIADATITLIQYMLLNLRFRFDRYESKGALFDVIKDQVINQALDKRLWGLFLEVVRLVELVFEDADFDSVMEKIFSNEEALELLIGLFNPPDTVLSA